MTDETKVEEGQDVEESKGPPVPEISESSEPAGSEGPKLDADAVAGRVLEQLGPQLDELVDRRFKSAKDRRFSKVEEILQWVEEAGGDPSKIQGTLKESELDARLAKIEEQIQSVGAGGAAPTDLEAETASILESWGIESDAEWVSEMAGKSYASEAAWYAALSKEAAKHARQAAEPTSSAAVAPGAGTPPAGKDAELDALASEYQKLRTSGNMTDPKVRQRMEEITARMDELEPAVHVDQGMTIEAGSL